MPRRCGARRSRSSRAAGRCGLAGAVLGVLLWHVAGEIGGDGLFHLARVRKLVAFDDLSLSARERVRRRRAAPRATRSRSGTAFLALVAKVAHVDPAKVVLHEATILAPLAVLVAYEAGYALFRRVAPRRGRGRLPASRLVVMAPGHGGAYTALALPATASRQLLVPAALALALAAARSARRGASLATAAAASLVLAVVHPTYAIFLWIPFARLPRGALGVEAGGAARRGARARRRSSLPAAAFFVWLLPVVRSTASVSPDAAERARGARAVRGPAARALGRQLLARARGVRPGGGGRGRRAAADPADRARDEAALGRVRRRRLARRLRDHARPVAVHAVLGRRLAVAVPPARRLPSLRVRLRRRHVGARRARRPVRRRRSRSPQGSSSSGSSPATSATGSRTAAPPGRRGSPSRGARRARRRASAAPRGVERTAALACALFLLPVFVHGLLDWSPSPDRRAEPAHAGARRRRCAATCRSGTSSTPISSRATASLRSRPSTCATRRPGTSPTRRRTGPYERRDDARRFFRTGDLAVPRACGARWLVLDRDRFDLAPDAAGRLPRRPLHALPASLMSDGSVPDRHQRSLAVCVAARSWPSASGRPPSSSGSCCATPTSMPSGVRSRGADPGRRRARRSRHAGGVRRAGRPLAADRRHAAQLSVRRFYALVLGGVGANNVLPLRIGDLLRGRWLATRAAIPTGTALGSVFRDRACDVLTLVVALAVSIVARGRSGLGGADRGRRRRAASPCSPSCSLAAIVYTRTRPRARLASTRPLRRLRAGHDRRGRLADRRRRLVWALVLSCCAWGCWALAAGARLPRRSASTSPPADAVFVTAVINLGVVIPSSPGLRRHLPVARRRGARRRRGRRGRRDRLLAAHAGGLVRPHDARGRRDRHTRGASRRGRGAIPYGRARARGRRGPGERS